MRSKFAPAKIKISSFLGLFLPYSIKLSLSAIEISFLGIMVLILGDTSGYRLIKKYECDILGHQLNERDCKDNNQER